MLRPEGRAIASKTGGEPRAAAPLFRPRGRGGYSARRFLRVALLTTMIASIAAAKPGTIS